MEEKADTHNACIRSPSQKENLLSVSKRSFFPLISDASVWQL